MPDKLTDEEIKKALECCINNSNCSKCPLKTEDCRKKLISSALDLINRLQAEDERSKIAYKECIAQLEAKIESNNKLIREYVASNIQIGYNNGLKRALKVLKELVGEDNASPDKKLNLRSN